MKQTTTKKIHLGLVNIRIVLAKNLGLDTAEKYSGLD